MQKEKVDLFDTFFVQKNRFCYFFKKRKTNCWD